MIYVDSTIFVFALLYDPSESIHAHISQRVLMDIALENIPACTSSLTWDEIVYAVRKNVGDGASVIAGEKFLGYPNLQNLRTDSQTLKTAQQIISKYSIGPRDAIHVASAIRANARAILSNDSDFNRIQEIAKISLEEFYDKY